MKVLPYTHIHDFNQISAWFKARGKEAPDRDSYPAIGFIVPGIAASFLVSTDTNFALSEFTITNPKTSPEERDLAINAIFDKIEEEARNKGYKYLLGNTQSLSLLRKAAKKGYKDIGLYSHLTKEL